MHKHFVVLLGTQRFVVLATFWDFSTMLWLICLAGV